jgi:hypothetical protein
MKKKDLAARLAQQTQQSEGAAADALDLAIHDVLRNMRHPEHPQKNALQRLLEEAKVASVKKGRNARS